MPRSNHPRRRKAEDDDGSGLSRLIAGWKRTEHRRGNEWYVQPISAAQATKSYSCPGCQLAVAPATAHLVVWRADGVMGDSADLAGRRHWHSHCWSIA